MTPFMFSRSPAARRRESNRRGWLELLLKGREPTVVTLVLALSACAPQLSQIALWSKPGASYDAFLQDRFACIQAARITRPVSLIPGGAPELPPAEAVSGEVVNAQIFWPCMAARGWGYNLVAGYRAPPGYEVWTVTPVSDEWPNRRSNYVANRHPYLSP